jgi:hypothetical protein
MHSAHLLVVCFLIAYTLISEAAEGSNSSNARSSIDVDSSNTIVKVVNTRDLVKTLIDKSDSNKKHLIMNESDYGTYLGLRPVENARPERNAICKRRKSDGKFACLPDVIYIGTSKSGTTSMASHLAEHPMIQNIVSKKDAERWRSKEGHYWERETIGRGFVSTDLDNWVNLTKVAYLEHQEGFDTLENRPVLIEYSPNYFILELSKRN